MVAIFEASFSPLPRAVKDSRGAEAFVVVAVAVAIGGSSPCSDEADEEADTSAKMTDEIKLDRSDEV